MSIALHDKLKSKVTEWRASKYESDYPAVSETLDYNYDSETQSLHYLRKAQFEALENYWYLRLREGTPHIFDLYTRFYTDSIKLLTSFGVPTESQEVLKLALSGGIDSIFEKIKSDEHQDAPSRVEMGNVGLMDSRIFRCPHCGNSPVVREEDGYGACDY